MADTAADGEQRIHVGETSEGDPLAFPIVEMLTGRGFVTGKSGSGKSNTTSVVVEELLEAGYPVLIVDTDGEYYGLKEEYELLHAGADEECDIQVGTEHAQKLAHLALEDNVPIILDVSGYLDEDEADELLRETVRHLFAKEKKLKKPFLLVVEECHEYIPQGGGMGETGNLLIKVGKRGRKHGLGVVGISQRPADVKKDFITQANWLAWHRLTWENDTNVVKRIVGSEYAEEVVDLDAGEAFIQTDWTDENVRRVQFKRKRTFDAGATPGLDDFERPDLKSVSGSLTEDLDDITSRKEQERDRIAELESKVENREERIAELESQLETARDVSAAARKMANALAHGDAAAPDSYESTLQTKNQEIDRLEARIEELEARFDGQIAGGGTEGGGATGAESAGDGATDSLSDDVGGDGLVTGDQEPVTSDDGGQATNDGDTEQATDTDSGDENNGDSNGDDAKGFIFEDDGGDDGGAEDAVIDAVQERLRRRGERAALRSGAANGRAGSTATRERAQLRESAAATGTGGGSNGDASGQYPAPETAVDLLQAAPVVSRVNAARRDSNCNDDDAWNLVSDLATTPGSDAHHLAASADVDVEAAHTLLRELRARDLVVRDNDRRYWFDADEMRTLVERDDPSKPRTELRDQWRT
jgi:uncharacterized coiled-coil protein SlyX